MNKHSFFRFIMLSLVISAGAMATRAQTPDNAPPACDRARAMSLVEEQIAEARTIDQPAQRIAVLIRAADFLWTYREETARAAFTEAFDLAVEHFRARGDESRREGNLSIALPDQRFAVLGAIARRDPVWSRRLAVSLAEESRREAETESARSSNGARNVSDKLIVLAMEMLDIDRTVAVSLARNSFRHPASLMHPRFLYKLAETDRATADVLCREAITAYASTSAEDLFQISAYVFGAPRPVGPTSSWTGYVPPPSFTSDAGIERAFLEALFRRAEVVIRTPQTTAARTSQGFSESGQIYAALNFLEPMIAQRHPTLVVRTAEIKAALFPALSSTARNGADFFAERQRASDRPRDFETLAAQAERETDNGRRDTMIFNAVQVAARESVSVSRVETLAERMSDANTRRQMMSWFYFTRAQKLIRDDQLDDAARLVERVEGLDHRAYLQFEIAAAGLERLNDEPRAREILNRTVDAARRAPNTNEKARTLLGITHLFARFDTVRAFETMREATQTINQLTGPDFSSTSVFQRIESRSFGFYSSYEVQGFSLENVFRELGALDFDGALLIARSFNDKSLRASAVIALSAKCLEDEARGRRTQTSGAEN